MTRERIRNEQDARDLLDEYHKPKHHKSNVTVDVDPRADHRMTGTGADGFTIDQQAMLTAYSDLGDLRAELEKQLDVVRDLAAPLPDGGGPVARQMRKAYRDRADENGGVQAVLEDYLAELDEVQETIRLTLETYANLDADAATMLRAVTEVD